MQQKMTPNIFSHSAVNKSIPTQKLKEQARARGVVSLRHWHIVFIIATVIHIVCHHERK